MWFFDSIIAEEETSTTATAVLSKKAPKEAWINNDLIIIDDMSFPETFKQDEIPQKAEENDIVFLDDAEKIEETVQESISEEKIKQPEIEINLWNIIWEAYSKTWWDDSSTGDDSKKWDPNIILDEAVKKLKELLNSHIFLREKKMTEVEEINSQIATLKEEAKKLTNESKNISDEESKINKMIELLNTQKIS